MDPQLSLRTTRLAIVILAATTLVGPGCSSSSTAVSGTGGKVAASGGSTGTGGHGGTTGTGGATLGTGGSTSSGGATVSGTGGDTGTGGAGGMVCTTPVYTHVSAFGSIFDNWGVAMNSSPLLVPVMATGDAGAFGTKAELDLTDGSPTPPPGSAKLTIPFDGPGEQLLFANIYNSGVNLTGTTVSAQIKLDSGLNTTPTNSGQAFFVLKSTSGFVYAAGNPINLDPSAGWVTLSISADAPSATLPFGYTACDIREIDIQIQTGQVGAYTQAVVHIDTISISAPTAAPTDGGAADEATDTAGQ